MTKSRFSLRSVAKIAVACLAVCMMFASCSKKNDSGGEGATNGWPPASVLSKYGLDGMSAPAGFKSGFYTEGSDYQLLISFEGNTSTAASVKSYFANGGWVNGGVTNSGGYTTTTYAIVATDGTTRYAVNFLERSDNTFQLTAVKGQ